MTLTGVDLSRRREPPGLGLGLASRNCEEMDGHGLKLLGLWQLVMAVVEKCTIRNSAVIPHTPKWVTTSEILNKHGPLASDHEKTSDEAQVQDFLNEAQHSPRVKVMKRPAKTA